MTVMTTANQPGNRGAAVGKANRVDGGGTYHSETLSKNGGLPGGTQRRSTNHPLQLFLDQGERLPLLTASNEHDLARQASRGDLDAKDALIESHLPLVVSIARR